MKIKKMGCYARLRTATHDFFVNQKNWMRSARYARFFGFYKKLDDSHDFLDSTKN